LIQRVSYVNCVLVCVSCAIGIARSCKAVG